MTFEVRFRIRMGDLLAHIRQEYGSLEGLARYIKRHPDDSSRILLYEAAYRYGRRPEHIVTFGRMVFGRPRGVLSPARLELLECLMRRPGLSLRELARAVERNPATVSEHLEELAAAGLVAKESRGAGRPVSLRALPQEIEIRLTPDAGEAAA